MVALIAAVLLMAGVPLEEGATFLEGGVCVEADGTYGLSAIDGRCVTPADYAATRPDAPPIVTRSVAPVSGEEPVTFPEIVERAVQRWVPM